MHVFIAFLLAASASAVDDVAAPIVRERPEPKFSQLGVITNCVVPGMVALTYDDGVSKYTSKLLDILKDEGIRATFFVLGKELKDDMSLSKRLLKRMWAAGHDIGSHSYDHPYLTDLSDAQITEQMDSTADLIKDCIGHYPLAMRPPYGDVNPHVVGLLKGMGYKVVCWNVDSDDWRMTGSEPSHIADHITAMFSSRSQNPRKSYIVLQHDTLATTVQAQLEIIRDLKAKGYKFGNISECLGDVSVYQKQ